jgi:hypothetical protein
MEEPSQNISQFTINLNIFGGFMVSADVMNKINKLIDKDQKNQLKQQNKKIKFMKKIADQYNLLNKPKTIIEI